MGNLFGTTTNPSPAPPLEGVTGQANFFDALGGATLTQQPGGGYQFASMPAYTGQLTPNLNNMMASNVWNSWSAQPQGMSQIQSQLSGINGLLGNSSGSNYLNGLLNGGANAVVSYPTARQVPANPGPSGGMAPVVGGPRPSGGQGQQQQPTAYPSMWANYSRNAMQQMMTAGGGSYS